MDEYERNWCRRLVEKLIKMPLSLPFRDNPNANNQIPNYKSIIQKPMWLNKIKEKLDRNEYKSATEVKEDLKRVCKNAIKFNNQNSPAGQMALDMKNEIIKNFAEKPSSKSNEWAIDILKLNIRLQKLLDNMPNQFINSSTPLPKNFSTGNLDLKQIKKIGKATGERDLSVIPSKWPTYANRTRRAIINALEQ